MIRLTPLRFLAKLLSRKIEIGERYVPVTDDYTNLEGGHLWNYVFSENYCHNKKVLDIGCGYGYGSKYLSNRSRQVIGIDLSPKALKHAKTYFSSYNCEYCMMDASKLGFKSNTFDVVTCIEVLEHVKSPPLLLSNILEVLKQGGLLIITTPNKVIRVKKGLFHEREFTPFELRIALQLAGFNNILVLGKIHEGEKNPKMGFLKLFLGYLNEIIPLSLVIIVMPHRFKNLIEPLIRKIVGCGPEKTSVNEWHLTHQAWRAGTLVALAYKQCDHKTDLYNLSRARPS